MFLLSVQGASAAHSDTSQLTNQGSIVSRFQPGRVNAAILAGDEDLTQWTDEELIRGQRRDKHGTWGGRPPVMVPSVVHQELTSRRMAAVRTLLNKHSLAAVMVLVEVATDKKADASARVKAAGMILDRTIGRAPLNVVLDLEEPPWAQAIRHSIVQIVSLDANAIEATAVDTDEDDATD